MKYIEVLESVIFSLPSRQIKGPGKFSISKDESSYIVKSNTKFRFITEEEFKTESIAVEEIKVPEPEPIIETIVEEVVPIQEKKGRGRKKTKDILGTGKEID